MGNVQICNCKESKELENTKKVIIMNAEEDNIKSEEGKIKNTKTKDETIQRKIFLSSEKQTRRKESNLDKTTDSVEKNNISNSQRESMLNSKLRNKIVKKTHGRRSVFLNRTSVNIIIVGDKNVGKSSFALKLKNNKYNDKYTPNDKNDDERFIFKNVNGERTYHLNVAIINNENNIKEETRRQLDYCLIFYDMNNENSIDFAINLFSNYLKSELENVNNNSLSHVIFIGNKFDINKQVNDKIIDICDKFKMNHFEISVKDNINIEQMINKLTQAFDNDEFENRK